MLPTTTSCPPTSATPPIRRKKVSSLPLLSQYPYVVNTPSPM
jgi:hypothetical protein